MKEARVARELAVAAGDFLLKRQPSRRRVSFKSGVGNIVTDADRASERRIVRGLRRAFPDHDIIAEEGTRIETGSPYRWYIDPLDGTTNYAHGFPVFAVSIALEVRGRLEVGVVYAPALRDRYEAVRGLGARRNGRRIHVSTTSRLDRSLLVTGFPYQTRGKRRNLEYFRRFLFDTRAVRRVGSASVELSWMACGIFDGYWEFDLGSWDIAAGMLLVSEAGGRVTNFRGGPVELSKGEILATNRRLHGVMMRRLRRPV